MLNESAAQFIDLGIWALALFGIVGLKLWFQPEFTK